MRLRHFVVIKAPVANCLGIKELIVLRPFDYVTSFFGATKLWEGRATDENMALEAAVEAALANRRCDA